MTVRRRGGKEAISKRRMIPIHPGEVLLEVYMKASSRPITVGEMAKAVKIPKREIANLIKGLRNITPAMASKLGSLQGTTPDYWMGLQKTYDIQMRTFTLVRRGVQRPHK